MKGKALLAGLKEYLGSLAVTILFPLLWLRAVRLARRHAADDKRATLKVGVAIVAGLLLFAGGANWTLGLREKAIFHSKPSVDAAGNPTTVQTGIYHSLDARLVVAVGEKTYQDAVTTIGAKENQIPIVQANLANATDPAKRTALNNTLNSAESDLANATLVKATMEPNHALYEQIHAAIMTQDDAAIHSIVDSNLGAFVDAKGNVDPKVAGNVATAFQLKDRAFHQMDNDLDYFVWPSVVGMFYVPLAFALGSILRRSFKESDTVGFRPYPGGAAGFFLLFGAFGLPSVPFAAWTFLDAEKRSKEGQIAL